MRTALIDGDLLVYKAALAAGTEVEWEEGVVSAWMDKERACGILDHELNRLTELVNADQYKVALSDLTNFRKILNPSYKSNRKNKKPVGFALIRGWLVEERGATIRPTLEADDVLGIWSTHPQIFPGEKVIVSADKDFKTVPGLFFDLTLNDYYSVDDLDATWWFYYQTLTGDSVDGYTGCPGVGPKKAEKALSKDLSWATVVATYEAAGLTEEDAIMQARMARILRWTDYDYERKEPRLWHPTSLP